MYYSEVCSILIHTLFSCNFVFVFKQKTAYEMRISDWSSDVCSSDLLARRASQTAIIWEGDDPAKAENISYQKLHDEVCRMANVMKAHGVKKGDRKSVV